jgi:hypothetical protein
MIHQAIFSLLTENEAVAALVDTRVYPAERIPQQAIYPLITYRHLDDSYRGFTLDGPDGLVQSTFIINSFARTQQAALELADAVRLAINGYYGQGSTWDEIEAIMLRSQGDIPQYDVLATAQLDGVEQQYLVSYNE